MSIVRRSEVVVPRITVLVFLSALQARRLERKRAFPRLAELKSSAICEGNIIAVGLHFT